MRIATGLSLLACSALAFGHHSRSHYPEQKQELSGEQVTFLGSESELRPRDMLATHLLLADGTEVLLERVRIIHMDDAAPPADAPASHLGHSVGRWEEGTLVVTTTRIFSSIRSMRVSY